MKIIKCDLCGKEAEEHWAMNLIPPSLVVSSISLDLCNTCAKKLTEFLEEEVCHEADHTAEGHTPKMS